MKAIEIKNLTKTYSNGTQALKNIDLEVEEGDFFALLGANGAGKTTVIGILTDLVNKSAGEVKIFGHDIDKDFSVAKKFIGVVPQEINLNIFERAIDILVTQAGYYGIPRKEALPRAEELLKRLGLWEKRFGNPRTYSGGMKRRLMIARALIHEPKMLFLDEPTAGVDVEIRHEMWSYLRDRNKAGLTILLTTHYLEEVEQMCRNAAIIKGGEIIMRDSVRNLLKFMDKETYVVTVQQVKDITTLGQYKPKVIDETTLEIEMSRKETLHDFFSHLGQTGMILTDIRPKGHRLEKLFLEVLSK
jgi:ABC-2 type transport system ATP-binding protein